MKSQGPLAHAQTPPRFVTGVDGLRSLAVIAVIIYHLLPNRMPGGFLGVPLFLLISGYFVTNQLTNRWQQGQGVRLRQFYRRRFSRLYPPLVGMLMATSAYITLFDRPALVHLRTIVVTNLTWVYNWWAVGHGQSYFDRFTAVSPFTHLWTLGVEAQFYLLWPVLLLASLKHLGLTKTRWLTLGLAIASAVAMAVLYDPANINRVYYGTDTRAFAMLLGSWLALVWPRQQLTTQLQPAARRILEGVGLVALGLTVASFLVVNGESASTYRGGMFVTSLLGMILLATIVHPGARVNQWLTNPVFHYLGQRSYGIYIYQLPVMVFYEALFPVGNHPLLSAGTEIILILLISELSYQLIELPTAHRNWRDWLAWRPQTKLAWGSLVSALVILGVALVGIFGPQPQPTKSALQTQLQHSKQATAARNKQIKAGKVPQVDVSSPSLQKKYQLTKQQLAKASTWQVTAVGDSVMVDAAGDLQEVMPHAIVDAQVGRQGDGGLSVLKDLAAKDQLAPKVVVNLGTNGAISDQTAREIIATVGDRQLYWITPHVPTKPWQKQVVKQVHELARTHKNVHEVAWNAKSADHPAWFGKDNVHMNEVGNAQFTRLLVVTMLKEGK